MLKKVCDNDAGAISPIDVIKSEKFITDIKELAVYLGDFTKYHKRTWGAKVIGRVDTLEDYDYYVLRKENKGEDYFTEYTYICLAGGMGKSKSEYVKMVVENIFPCRKIYYENGDLKKGEVIKYGDCDMKTYRRNFDDVEKMFLESTMWIGAWRDDIKYLFHSESLLKDNINYIKSNDFAIQSYMKEYNIFWNIFLLSLDNEVYEKNLNDVIELAYYWDFDEPMMRDWCMAVEYVLAGNKLSEDCDFECETVEGLKFFLHRDE